MYGSSGLGGGEADFPSEKYHSGGDDTDGASREFTLFSQNTIEEDFSETQEPDGAL